MSSSLIAPLSADDVRDWGSKPLRLSHNIHASNLFTPEALAGLIESYPPEKYGLHDLGSRNEKDRWREGKIGQVSGNDVIDRIAKGSLWLNLRSVTTVHAAYAALAKQIFEELRVALNDFNPTWINMGILISSPLARVPYHADMPGQALVQIHGRKKVFVYPADEPYLTPEGLENIALDKLEVSLPYDPEFDRDATVLELAPGEWLHWPLNAPHRVENYDCLNVSVTFEYLTPAIRRHQIVTSANGIIRRKMRMIPRSSAIDGPGYWAKALLHAGMRKSGLINRGKPSKTSKSASFTLSSHESRV